MSQQMSVKNTTETWADVVKKNLDSEPTETAKNPATETVESAIKNATENYESAKDTINDNTGFGTAENTKDTVSESLDSANKLANEKFQETKVREIVAKELAAKNLENTNDEVHAIDLKDEASKDFQTTNDQTVESSLERVIDEMAKKTATENLVCTKDRGIDFKDQTAESTESSKNLEAKNRGNEIATKRTTETFETAQNFATQESHPINPEPLPTQDFETASNALQHDDHLNKDLPKDPRPEEAQGPNDMLAREIHEKVLKAENNQQTKPSDVLNKDRQENLSVQTLNEQNFPIIEKTEVYLPLPINPEPLPTQNFETASKLAKIDKIDSPQKTPDHLNKDSLKDPRPVEAQINLETQVEKHPINETIKENAQWAKEKTVQGLETVKDVAENLLSAKEGVLGTAESVVNMVAGNLEWAKEKFEENTGYKLTKDSKDPRPAENSAQEMREKMLGEDDN